MGDESALLSGAHLPTFEIYATNNRTFLPITVSVTSRENHLDGLCGVNRQPDREQTLPKNAEDAYGLQGAPTFCKSESKG
jgi:hypothetical protein